MQIVPRGCRTLANGRNPGFLDHNRWEHLTARLCLGYCRIHRPGWRESIPGRFLLGIGRGRRTGWRYRPLWSNRDVPRVPTCFQNIRLLPRSISKIEHHKFRHDTWELLPGWHRWLAWQMACRLCWFLGSVDNGRPRTRRNARGPPGRTTGCIVVHPVCRIGRCRLVSRFLFFARSANCGK